jgi:predicted nucleic acid-binding Zn ribbon protein
MRPIGAILRAVVERYRWHEAEAFLQVAVVWPKAVGPMLTQVTRPLSLLSGQLTVAVPSPVWVQELNYLQDHLLGSLNAQLEGVQIQRIRFVVRAMGRGPAQATPDASATWVARLRALREQLEQNDNPPPPV